MSRPLVRGQGRPSHYYWFLNSNFYCLIHLNIICILENISLHQVVSLTPLPQLPVWLRARVRTESREENKEG